MWEKPYKWITSSVIRLKQVFKLNLERVLIDLYVLEWTEINLFDKFTR